MIIEEDEEQVNEENHKEEVLAELVQQKICPTMFILGDKNKILEQMKAEEERQSKEKKELETKKLI